MIDRITDIHRVRERLHDWLDKHGKRTREADWEVRVSVKSLSRGGRWMLEAVSLRVEEEGDDAVLYMSARTLCDLLTQEAVDEEG